jgi:hypothetical protein
MPGWFRRRPRVDLATVLEAVQAVQADVRRLGSALVRVESASRNASSQVEAMGRELAQGLERLRQSLPAAGGWEARLAEQRARWLRPLLDLADRMTRARDALSQSVPPGGEPAEAPQADPGDVADVLARLQADLERILRDAGLRPVAAVGMPFDPRLHRALGGMQRPELAGRIALVDRQGYLLDGTLLRPAEVWVGLAGPPGAPEDGGSTELGAPEEAAGESSGTQ